MGTVVLVTGGARGGKSVFAETLAAGLGACVTYVATAEVSDAEMEARVARHRERRPASWITREAPLALKRVELMRPADNHRIHERGA